MALLIELACQDPTDIEALDETPLNAKSVKVDQAAEAKRPEYRRQAQNWVSFSFKLLQRRF